MKKFNCSIIVDAEDEDDAYTLLMDIDGHDVDWTIEETEEE